MKLRFAIWLLSLCVGWLAAAAPAENPTWKAGIATTIITPSKSLWMGGYGARTKPSQGTQMELRLKALALEDAKGQRAVVVTCDLLGIPQTIYRHTCATLKQRLGLAPEQVILAASHTHSGPLLRESAIDTFGLDDNHRALVAEYSAELEDHLANTVERAFAGLKPARLAGGEGKTGFAVNRRNNVEREVPKILLAGQTPRGPVDHAVPVLAVSSPEGTLQAVLFGYACHNTVLDGYEWSADYAGFAQLALEKSHPGATAMFFMGCGGDQNPLPRRQSTLAERYGTMLASAVEEVLLLPPKTLPPTLAVSMEMVDLALGTAPTEAEVEKAAADTRGNATARRWGARLQKQIQSGKPLARTYPYPIQAWQLGGRQLLIALGGEPVVDYSLLFKKEFGPEIWVAGYCNDVMAYIPSLRVLKEDMPPLAEPRWGYEGSTSMMPYGLPARRWSAEVENQIEAGVRRLMTRLRSSEK